jgi:TolB-like protein/cytochrome c-type biogenesis protein CcmH/NrfG
VQTELRDDSQLRLRIGIHLGDVVFEDGRVYGDGVNVASRVRPLAEPGGICISEQVYDSVKNQPNLEAISLGEQELKNVERPLEVFALRGNAVRPAPTALPGVAEFTVPGFGGRPAIAVLPFENLSRDSDQEYFADGIVEDLITRLSLWRTFPVIARNSSFVYRGGAVDVKQVSRELGVRYVVEGSVRRSGDRVRVSAQLIDATTGHHLWAERYDRELEDIFALQDEITEQIVGSVLPELGRSEMERASRRDPRSLDAWEAVQRANWHIFKYSREDNARARELLDRPLEVDPNFIDAISSLSMTHLFDFSYGWSESPARSLAESLRLAERCTAIDDTNPLGQWTLAVAHALGGDPHKAITAAKRAVQLNPSLPTAYWALGASLLFTGGSLEDAIENLEKATRLSPRDPVVREWVLTPLFAAHFAAGRYEVAADLARQSLRIRPDPRAWRILAASSAQLGQLDEARSAFQEMLRLQPDFSWSDLRVMYANADPDFVERYHDALRQSGLEE